MSLWCGAYGGLSAAATVSFRMYSIPTGQWACFMLPRNIIMFSSRHYFNQLWNPTPRQREFSFTTFARTFGAGGMAGLLCFALWPVRHQSATLGVWLFRASSWAWYCAWQFGLYDTFQPYLWNPGSFWQNYLLALTATTLSEVLSLPFQLVLSFTGERTTLSAGWKKGKQFWRSAVSRGLEPRFLKHYVLWPALTIALTDKMCPRFEYTRQNNAAAPTAEALVDQP